MKRSKAALRIMKKLGRSAHLFEAYKKGNYDRHTLFSNIALRILTECEEMGMLPPPDFTDAISDMKIECRYKEGQVCVDEDYEFVKIDWEPEE